MTRPFVALGIGFCALATAWASLRLIAPFSGLGLTLSLSLLAATLGGFALGSILAPGPRPGGRAAPGPTPWLLAAAALTLLAVWLRTPLLLTLDRLDVRQATILASALMVGVPCALLGAAFAALHLGADAPATLKGTASLLLGAALAAPLVALVLVPGPGVRVALLLVAVFESALAALVGNGRARPPAALGLVLALAASVFIARSPASSPGRGAGLVMVRETATAEFRVLDRGGARYMLSDGTVHTMVDTLSGDCIHRGPVALDVLKLLRPGRDSMLVLGLRGGALPLSFARAGWRVSVVEPDSAAVAAARLVSFKQGETPLEAADPRRFLRRDTRHHSVVVVDTFGDSEMPFTLCTREFFATLAARLQPDGIAAVLVETHGWDDALVGTLAATMRESLPHVVALPTVEPPDALGTMILLASRGALTIPDEQLPDLTGYLQNPDALWAAQQLKHAWLSQFEPPRQGAVVMTDDRTPIDLWSDRLNLVARRELHQFFGSAGGSW